MSQQQVEQRVANAGIFAADVGGTQMSNRGGNTASVWGDVTDSGRDRTSAMGGLDGDLIGNAYGTGLGNAGIGIGGGGNGEGTQGMGPLNTVGRRGGNGGETIGMTVGNRLQGRPTGAPAPRALPPVVSDGLAPEAIRRVVQRNLAQIAHCHEAGLAQNPTLSGRIAIRFVIGPNGSVLAAGVAQSSVSVPTVGTCITSAVRRWNFPAPPSGGTVTVTYPFMLTPPQ
jgi:TonB family protein